MRRILDFLMILRTFGAPDSHLSILALFRGQGCARPPAPASHSESHMLRSGAYPPGPWLRLAVTHSTKESTTYSARAPAELPKAATHCKLRLWRLRRRGAEERQPGPSGWARRRRSCACGKGSQCVCCFILDSEHHASLETAMVLKRGAAGEMVFGIWEISRVLNTMPLWKRPWC